jgi:hypothetical protein
VARQQRIPGLCPGCSIERTSAIKPATDGWARRPTLGRLASHRFAGIGGFNGAPAPHADDPGLRLAGILMIGSRSLDIATAASRRRATNQGVVEINLPLRAARALKAEEATG